jgi:MFS family permease
MTCIGCAFALTGSQIHPLLYLTLGTTIAQHLNATHIQVWMFSASIIAVGALAPFVGPLADVFGRKTLFLIGLVCSVIGSILSAATPNAAGFIAAQVFVGLGSVMQELLSIAVVGEIVPTAKRSLYAAMILCAIIPWAPGTLYANWITQSSWRWLGLIQAIWNLITFALLAIFYRPPPRVNALGLSFKEKLGRIDFIGGFLLTLGTLLFLIGLNWGGEQYSWQSSHVVSFFVIGSLLVATFCVWEKFGAAYPLFPRRIIHVTRPFFSLMVVIFAAAINYVGLVVFWPIQSISVYGSDRFQTGVNTLPIGLCIVGGAILSATLLAFFAKRATLIMTFFCVMQTVGTSSSSKPLYTY